LPSKNRGEVLMYTFNKTLLPLSPPLFFTGRKLRPPGIGIEATAYKMADGRHVFVTGHSAGGMYIG